MYPSLHGVPSVHGEPISSSPLGDAGFGGGGELGKGLSKFVIIEMYPSLHGVPSVHGEPISSSPLGDAGFGGGGDGVVRPLLVVT